MLISTSLIVEAICRSSSGVSREDAMINPSQCGDSDAMWARSRSGTELLSAIITPSPRSSAARCAARTIGGKNGLVMSGTISPSRPVLPVTSARACRFGT